MGAWKHLVVVVVVVVVVAAAAAVVVVAAVPVIVSEEMRMEQIRVAKVSVYARRSECAAALQIVASSAFLARQGPH